MFVSSDNTTYSNDNMVWFWQGPFSNFHSCEFTEDGLRYNCSEQYFMAKKALLFKDIEMYNKIMSTNNPKSQKSYGRKVKNFDDKIWYLECEKIMYNANLLKYSQNEELQKLLLQTENKELVEASPYDKIWGVGLGPRDKNIIDKNKWKGLNKLGKVLIKVRYNIKKKLF